jgi:hypothetical protein
MTKNWLLRRKTRHSVHEVGVRSILPALLLGMSSIKAPGHDRVVSRPRFYTFFGSWSLAIDEVGTFAVPAIGV